MTKSLRLFALILWGGFLAALYWGMGNTPWTLPITYLYFALCILLSLAYVLVSGGIRPLLAKDRENEEKVRKMYLADKAKSHPLKSKDKYRRFRIKPKNAPAEHRDPLPPAPNPLHIPEEKRALISQLLLIAVIPFYLIFMADLLILKFIA